MAARFTQRYQLTAPSLADGVEPALARLTQAHWWTRQLRQHRRRFLDAIQRDLGVVQKHRGIYCGDFALSLHREQQARNQHYLDNTTLVNEVGDTVQLSEIAQHTIAHPAIRRAELMARIRGFESIADLYGHAGEFYTLTTPSRFHAQLSDGRRNLAFSGETAKAAQRWLCETWQLIRSQLHREEIRPYGFRVAEPHHDGTPHWHFLIFAAPEHAQRVRKVFRRYALREREAGANKHRFKSVAIDKSRGTAAGYIAKYISKSIDGAHLDTDQHGTEAGHAAERVVCWSRTWGIRQFQQVGGPSVTVWRELRRLKAQEAPSIEQARDAADAGDWAAYVLAMGGIDAPRKTHPIKPHYAYRETVNTDTGEILCDDSAWHGGRKAPPLRGLACGSELVMTRNHIWTAKPTIEPADCEEPYQRRPPLIGPQQAGGQRCAAPHLDSCK